MMQDQNISKSKKKDNMFKFVIANLRNMIIGGLFGCFVGHFLGSYIKTYKGAIGKHIGLINKDIFTAFNLCVPFVNILIAVIIGIVLSYLIKKARKLYCKWDHENEDEIIYIEKLLCYAGEINSIVSVFVFFFFAAGIITMKTNITKITIIVCWILGFVMAMLFIIIANQKILVFYKEINPEKQVSPLNKYSKWIDRCDEAEQLYIYKCSYKSFVMVNRTCKLLWLFCIFGMLFWNLGLVPIVLITMLWIVLVSSYYIEANRIQKSYQR